MALTQTLTNNLPSLKPPSTPQPPQQRSRPYKDFLTPALHRRFTRAALLVFAACYLASLLMRPPSLLWLWNPLSATGIRACMLFMSCLAVFIVRVANMYCGELVTASPAESAWAAVAGWRGLVTLGWYVYSACFFGEVYIWSRHADAGLGWVDYGREDEWALLNENPIFLRAVFFCLAVAQTAVHLGRGEDRMPIPVKDEAPIGVQQQQQAAPSKVPKSLQILQARLPAIGLRTLKLAIPTLAFTLPAYFIVLRPLLWPYFYTIGHFFFQSKLAQQSRPTGLTDVPHLVWQCLTSSAILILLWEISNAAFTIHVARPPLSKAEDEPLTGLMITGEKGKDPNGSLISGLKAKKEVPRLFAFWELSLICTHYPTRRKTIYTEVDRAGGSTWTQISTLCLNEITAIQSRIQAAQTPPAQQQQPQAQAQQQQPYLGLPRIADRSVQSGDVWAQPQHQSNYAVHSVANMAKSIGQSPGAQNPALPKARKAIEWSADHVLTQENQARLSREGINKEASGFAVKILRTPPGEVFRQTFGRRVKGVVFGGDISPYSSAQTIIFASRALSILCTQSLKEDDFGQVAKSVASVVRTYVATIRAIEAFMAGWAPSWTDVGFEESDRKVAEVEEVVGVLKEGLEGVVLGFGEYASSLGLSKVELREATGVVGKGERQQEMASAK
ncbi:hypothetical protein LTR37_002310 [Vermiconidia calcicola]|uniref:Uncharacterized protein n=1 Tax=Vermiconidia calcicola TaxID=1690605 RepID=A0ACC3NT99_9PEZI|nr:hypothetical protein LTR37_002310 [Vermiconidia calcicola]